MKITIDQVLHGWYISALHRSFARREKALSHAQAILTKQARKAAVQAGKEHRK